MSGLSAIAALTRRLARTSLVPPLSTTTSIATSTVSCSFQQATRSLRTTSVIDRNGLLAGGGGGTSLPIIAGRTFSSESDFDSGDGGGNDDDGKKKKKKRKKKKVELEQRDNKRLLPTTNLQHEEWVNYQNELSIDGFQTGQITTVIKPRFAGGRARGGKGERLRKERKARLKKEQEAEEMDFQSRAERYSDEDTERLLAAAYAGIPKGTGKRGTRNLRRQKHRWFVVRKARAKQKNYLIAAHHRRMAKRSEIAKAVRQVKSTAPKMCAKEAAYQEYVLQRWTTAMLGEEEDGDEDGKDEEGGNEKAKGFFW